MKLFVALAIAIAIYVALGIVPFANSTALHITLFGGWGAFTYKGLVAIVAFFKLNAGK